MLLFLALACAQPLEPLQNVGDAHAAEAFVAVGLRPHVYADALQAHATATARGDVDSPLLTVIDYSLHPSKRRLWTIDLDKNELLFHEHVTHGKNSGRDEMISWSNVVDSKQTSIGVSKTAETYRGNHGLSLRLDGLEKGFNHNNRKRYIVIHGASYVGPEVASKTGRVGNSWGCPAVRDAIAKDFIHTIKNGTLVVAWYTDDNWRQTSRYLTD